MSNLCVLLPVASETSSLDLRRAHQSVLNQSRSPDEILLVTNQPLPDELNATITELVSADTVSQHEHFPEAPGLGGVLQAGLESCSSTYVARMDADDIAEPTRFAEQVTVLTDTDVDIVGGQLAEFHDDPERIERVRRVPTTHDGIADWMAWRCPINHPTVMFERDAVLNVGGYRHVPMMEDWDLWSRCLADGCRFRNLDRILVRAGITSLTKRRGGVAYAKTEIQMARELRRLGIASPFDTVRHLCARVPVRLLPVSVRKYIYRTVAR